MLTILVAISTLFVNLFVKVTQRNLYLCFLIFED